MWDKLRKTLYEASEVMELFMAGAVVLGLLIAAVTLWPELMRYWEHRMVAGAFSEYLDAVFNVVIGIEFIKMLCKPNSANIIEVLIFLIARHMIVATTTPFEDLLSVISISVLFYFRRFMPATRQGKDTPAPNLFHPLRPSGQKPGSENDALPDTDEIGNDQEP